MDSGLYTIVPRVPELGSGAEDARPALSGVSWVKDSYILYYGRGSRCSSLAILNLRLLPTSFLLNLTLSRHATLSDSTSLLSTTRFDLAGSLVLETYTMTT